MSELYENVVKCFAWLSIILELSKGRKITGYDILVHVKSFGLEVSAGTVYYQLSMLEKADLIKRKTGMRTHVEKTLYEMTEKGMKVFKEFKKKWKKPLEYVYQNFTRRERINLKKESKMEKYKITVTLKKPFTLVDWFPKYPSRDSILENLADALTHHELDDDLEIEIKPVEKSENTK